MLKTLAIETSCDDTSIGIVNYENGSFINPLLITRSQIEQHQLYGGVVPEIAYRLHEEQILSIIKEIGYNQIIDCDSITVTKEPGLPGSLVVGNTVASMLSYFFNKPLYRVNHIDGHIFSLLLDRNIADCPFPRLILTASGGHNEMYYINLLNNASLSQSNMIRKNLQIKKIGYSLDDAAGESFDKVARMLGGTYPGGPWISMMAKEYIAGKSVLEIAGKDLFKRILLDGKGSNISQERVDQQRHNFSFSGMKSQVYQLLTKRPLELLCQDDIAYICHEFQECISDILVTKVFAAACSFQVKTLGLVGGVSANDRLYEKLKDIVEQSSFDFHVMRPMKKVYSTDNAAMIGLVGLMQMIS